jgi:hypothetical protein
MPGGACSLAYRSKHKFFAYLLRTRPPGTFRVSSLSDFVDEVAHANSLFANEAFDKAKFLRKLKVRSPARRSEHSQDINCDDDG